MNAEELRKIASFAQAESREKERLANERRDAEALATQHQYESELKLLIPEIVALVKDRILQAAQNGDYVLSFPSADDHSLPSNLSYERLYTKLLGDGSVRQAIADYCDEHGLSFVARSEEFYHQELTRHPGTNDNGQRPVYWVQISWR